MEKNVHCLKCHGVMFTVGQLDEKNWAVTSDIAELLHTCGDYIPCPKCGAKNVVVERTNEGGLSSFFLSHIRE